MENKQLKKSKIIYCCVLNCKNNSCDTPDKSFYCFPTSNVHYPHKVQRREIWLRAIKKLRPDGSDWKPHNRSRICSDHFIGNKKSEDPRSPSYNPTIFPSIYKKKYTSDNVALGRYQRFLKRSSKEFEKEDLIKKKKNIEFEKEEDCNLLIQQDSLEENENNILRSRTVDQGCQVQIMCEKLDSERSSMHVFICNRYIYNDSTKCSAETQTCCPEEPKIIYNRKKMAEKSCGNQVSYLDKSVGTPGLLKCENGFHGLKSIKTDREMLDLAGVTLANFSLLLKIIIANKKYNYKKINEENKLLIFLFKMKCGLSFSALSVLFNIKRTTVSRIFYSVLQHLSSAYQNFITWPSRHIVDETMPKCFKENYSKYRVIIDCTEFLVETPSSIEHRVFFYSQYKKGYKLKILVGCTPSGFISFRSKCFGGRATDSQITIESGILNLLEENDQILADKGFPQVKNKLDKGKNVLLVMPPFLKNGTFSEEEVEETYRVASIRIHIERIMQRLRTYHILNKFTLNMLPYCDIITMCCVLVNLQPPIIADNDNN